MQRRGFENDEGVFLQGLVQVALGVFIGSLAALFAYEASVDWRLEQAAKRAAAQMQAEAARMNAEQAKERQAQERARQQAEELAAQRRSALALANRLAHERQERRDAAWTRFYQPSPACRADSGTAACANEYMAARKRFDAQYVDR